MLGSLFFEIGKKLRYLIKRTIIFIKYAYYHMLQKLDPMWSLEVPRFKSLALPQKTQAITDASNSIEFYLVDDLEAQKIFKQPTMSRQQLVTNIDDIFETNHCFICNEIIEPIIETIDINNKINKTQVSWCPRCDYLQYSRMPSKNWFTQWYRNIWDGSGTLDEKLSARQPTTRYYNRLKPYLKAEKLKILDIGAGYGEKISAFISLGHDVYCTEVTPRRAEYLKNNVTDNTFLGTLDDAVVRNLIIKNGPYDVIFSYHVIEHMFDAPQELSIINTISKEGTLFYIAIPELYKEGILENIYGIEHISSFSRKAACKLLLSLGFEILEAKDDLFQYYSNYCQYLIGRRNVGNYQEGFNMQINSRDVVEFVSKSLHLTKISSMNGNSFGYSFYNDKKLNFTVSDETKLKCIQIEKHLPIKIYHNDLPLFWI